MILTKMISIAGIRFFIEFSSILVLAFLCLMHEFTDVTWAKQFHFDHASTNQQQQQQPQKGSKFDGIDPGSHNYDHIDDHQSDNQQINKQFVRFSPNSLDFGHHSIGMPVIRTVHVYNDDDEINLQMISISGNTEHFHCSFFEEKILPPRSNTSFQIVFLARQEGLVNNTLYIHSSVGSFHYHVSAFGEISPFRVRPLIGARVPLNSSFASLIYIYNPFSTPLQLTEMYTSGGGLHLELLDDEYEAPSSIWNVPPYETRPVMRAHFMARIASNHTSYIRIRTNQPDIQLMLPVEVEVSNSPGLYSPLDTLDFGVLRARHDPPKTLPIQVINAAQKSVSVQSIVVTPISDGLTVADFAGPIKLPPQTSNPFHVGKLVLDPSQFSCSGLCLGKVLIKSKNNQYKLTIPFIVRVIQGELHFNGSQSHFFMNQSSNYSEQRVLSVENRFDSPIIVHDIILPDEAKPYFRLTTRDPYKLPVTLPVGESFPLIEIEFTPSPQLSHFSTVFRLLTNFSYFDLPLYAYQGRLDLFIPNSSDQSKLDMGLVGLNEHKSSTFVVANHNPIAIRLIYWNCNITGISVELVGTSQGNISAVSQKIEASIQQQRSSHKELRLLEPNYFAVFRAHANKLSKEGLHHGTISIMTAYEKLSVPLTIKVLRGSLSAEPVIMPKTFPGKIVKSSLNIKSNYSSNIKIKGAFIEPKDDRFKIKLIDQLIKPGQDNQLQIIFDPSAACFQKLCYTALDVEKEVGHLWLLGTGLYSDTAYIDKELYKLLRNQWLMMSETDRNPVVNVRLQIDGFGSFVAPIQAYQHWPRLANKLVIRFPSIRVGQKVTKELLIENTADRQVLVQAINVIDYPNSEILLQLTSNTIFHQQWSKSDLQAIQSAIRIGQNRSAFSLHNNTIATNSQVQRITEWLGVEPNVNSYIMMLPPGVRHRLAVTFNPTDEKNYTSLLILRNNLTIIDVVMLRGEGGRGLLKIGKTLPNTPNSRLVFDFPERTLERRCRNLVMAKSSSSSYSSSTIHSNGGSSSSQKTVGYNSLVMRERFKAVNIGRMALQIRTFLIDGMPCEGHGFRVGRCESVLILPNQTFDIEITYTPDFTQPTITHELTILIDDDAFSAQRFLLVANVPANLLTLCLEALPRPAWEPHLYYLLVMMALFVLILSTVVAIFDGHRIALNYYNLKYEFITNNNAKKHDDGDMDGNSGHGCKFENNDSINSGQTIDSGKRIANGGSNLSNGSAMLNGKHNYNSVSNNLVNQQQQKVRNRRGANRQQNNNHNHTNGNVQHQHQQRRSHQVSKSNPESTKSDSKSNGLMNFDTDMYSHVPNHSWSHLAQSNSDYIIRQDSSSSEHSNRSSDSSSNKGKNGGDSKKSSNDSLNETPAASNNNSSNNSPNATRQGRKSKREQSNSSQKHQPTETKNQSMKKSTTKSSSNKVKGESSKKEKNSKSNLNDSVVDSWQSSMESLSSTNKYSLGITDGDQQDDYTPKTRSATLPLNLNDCKNTESFNIDNTFGSESNISCPPEEPSSSVPLDKLVPNQDFEDINVKLPRKSSLENKSNNNNNKKEQIMPENSIFNCQPDMVVINNNKSISNNDFFTYSEPNNNKLGQNNETIWDFPITSFDSDMAMNQIVKQTEDFEKTTTGLQPLQSLTANRMSNIANNNNNYNQINRRNERNIGSMKFNSTIDDKWEIGEWSNDFLLDGSGSLANSLHANNNNNESMKHFGTLGNSNQSSFGNYDSSTMAMMKKYRFSPSSTINYQEYRNSLNDNNNSSRFLKSVQMYENNNSNRHQQTSPPPPPPPGPSIMPNSANNSNITSANHNSSLSSSSTSSTIVTSTATTSTFSPVIGRPPNSQQQHQHITPIQRSGSCSGNQTTKLNKHHRPFDRFEDHNFTIFKSFDKLNNKPLSLDLSPFDHGSVNNNKNNFLGNLDSFLETSPPKNVIPFNQTPNNGNGLGLTGGTSTSKTTGQTGDSMLLDSLLGQSEPWPSNPITEFPTFLSNSNRHPVSPKNLSGIFNLNENNSVWSSTSNWPPNTNSSKTSDMFAPFPGSSVVSGVSSSNNNNNWPISSVTANNSNANVVHRRNTENVGGANNGGGMWPAFDSFNYGSNFPPDHHQFNSKKMSQRSSPEQATTNINGNNGGILSPSGTSNNTPGIAATTTTFSNPTSVYELFGKSPSSLWSPLGSSPELNSNINNSGHGGVINSASNVSSPTGSNFLSPSPTPAEALFGRFSHNSSPSASSSCSGGGSGGGGSSSTNNDPK